MSIYSLDPSSKFEKQLSKLKRKDNKNFQKASLVLECLQLNPFETKLKTHKVNTKDYGETYSTRVTGDLRIIWKFKNGKLVILLLTLASYSGKTKTYK